MAIKLGSTDVTSLKLGSTDVSQAYLGATPLLSSGYDFGNALEFDGVNDGLIEAGTGTRPNIPSNTEFTISVWLNTQTAASSGQFWLTDRQNKDYWFFYPTQVFLRFNGSSSTQNVWSCSYTTYNGSWAHYMLARDSSNVTRLYQNGVLQTKSTSYDNNSNFEIKTIAHRYNNSKYYSGKMDDFVVKSGYCASAQDALDLYNSGAGVDPSTILSSPMSWWKFNETTGLLASDSGTNADDMTLLNFANNPNQWVAH